MVVLTLFMCMSKQFNKFEELKKRIADNNKYEILKQNLAISFCCSSDGCSDWVKKDQKDGKFYIIETIPFENILNSKDSQIKLDLIWNDFVAIQCNLIQTKLKEMLMTNHDQSGVVSGARGEYDSEGAVQYLFEHFYKFRRNMCGILPIHHPRYEIMGSKKLYPTMVNHFSNYSTSSSVDGAASAGAVSSILQFIVIFNGMSNLFLKWYQKKKNHGFGFDGYFFDTTLDDLMIGLDLDFDLVDETVPLNKDRLIELCIEYILNEISQTSIFGRFIVKLDDATEEQKQQEILKREKANKFMKQVLFDNNETKYLTQLFKYCTQDIDDVGAYSDNKYSGISFYIINRLSYVILHDLLYNIQTEKKLLLFPNLTKFFMFLYNFSIYFHLNPVKYGKQQETFYISQYLLFKNECFEDIFDNDIKNIANNTIKRPILDNFNYFNFNGTILFAAVYDNLRHYCQVLINDKFDFLHTYTKEIDENKILKSQNGYDIALDKQHYSILATMDDHKDDNVSNIKRGGNAKSIELKYQEFANQIYFSKYFLMILGCNVSNMTIDIECESLEGRRNQYKGCYSDDFFRNYNHFLGLRAPNEAVFKDLKESNALMNNIVLGTLKILDKKLVVSQDLLILSFEYCKQEAKNGNKELLNRFVEAINDVINDCLGNESNGNNTNNNINSSTPQKSKKNKFIKRFNKNKNKNKNKSKTQRNKNETEVSKYIKQRNYIWFKKYLLYSNIWMAKYEDVNDEKKNETDNDDTNTTLGVLFDAVEETVDIQLEKQKQV